MDQHVQRVYEHARERVWDAESDDDDEVELGRLSPLARAVYVTRELEAVLDDGGWYLVFANEDEWLLPLAVEAYELLGLPDYAEHIRDVGRRGYGDFSSEDDGEALDDAYRALTGAEQARATALATGEP